VRTNGAEDHRSNATARAVVVAALVLALLVLASGTGVFRGFRPGSSDRASEAVRAAIGAAAGVTIALVGTTLLRRRSRAVGARGQLLAAIATAGGAVLGAVVAIGAFIGAIVGVAMTRVGPVLPPVVDSDSPPPPRVPPPPAFSIPPAGKPQTFELPTWVGIVALVLCVAVVAYFGVMLLRQLKLPRFVLRARGATADASTATLAEVDREAAADSLEESARRIDDDPDPRRAIIAAYALLLERLAAAGSPRQRYEAPEEHLRRSLAALRVPAASLETVTERFLVARFSTHPLTEADRDVVREALRDAAGRLRSLEPSEA
jgi:hypothetical protein